MRSSPARRLLLMSVSVLGLLAAVAGTNRVGDPYGIWRTQLIDDVYRRCHDDRLSRAYRLLRERPRAILLGNSRVAWGMPIQGSASDGVFNAAFPSLRLDELEAVAGAAIRQPRVTRLVWAIDFTLFDSEAVAAPPERIDALRARLQGNGLQLVTEALLSLDALDESRRVIFRALGAPLGLTDPATPRAIAWSPAVLRAALARASGAGMSGFDRQTIRSEIVKGFALYQRYRFADRSLERVRDAVRAARAGGIDVSLVALPQSEYELEIIRQAGLWDLYLRWERRLLEIGPYWDFSGYTDPARMDDLFMDPVHFRPPMGHVILRHLLGEDCSECGDTAQVILATGVWVDDTSIDRHLAEQDARRMARTRESSAYAEAVADALATGVQRLARR